ncbi:MAG TPA: alpha-glucuronidase family glycosyl hydrolase [Candidatus Hydrogenedens sp.]|nr:alpha-glucuronidase family glycosyl hydrolase [Candidatus Hydrogenedens sp.]
MKISLFLQLFFLSVLFFPWANINADMEKSMLDLRDFKICLIGNEKEEVLNNIIQVLSEEIEKQTHIVLQNTVEFLPNWDCILITSINSLSPVYEKHLISFPIEKLQQLKPEGFAIFNEEVQGKNRIWIIGKDNRGVLFGVGKLLRIMKYSKNSLEIEIPVNIIESPISPIRGHQLGYRAQANSYDAWSIENYDQYIRELTFFGVNSIENIPFQDDRPAPLMPISRREMNRAMSEICKKYGLDYWVWTPADFDLNDKEKRENMLKKHEELYKDCPVITGVFFPGGDPGDNSPELVLPFLEDLSKLLSPIHPEAKIWLSLQGFTTAQAQFVFDYIKNKKPQWLGGLCEGPSSPPIAYLRQNLPAEYRLRMYPDITHNKLCQYPVPWWDIAFSSVIGREGINPRPVQYAYIHNWFQPYCDGFITYSDGIHDDVNKIIWSALGWNPEQKVRDILIEYSNIFFNSAIAEPAAEGILALENNWRGSIIDNGAIEGTLKLWQELEQKAPQLRGNWRWQMCLVRAYYDTYIRRKVIYEQELEEMANQVLQKVEEIGAEKAMEEAMNILNKAVTEPIATDLKEKIIELYNALFKNIGLQSSVEKYKASGGERGASLDYIDIPLNNRWWLEDQFQQIRQLGSEEEKIKRLNIIAHWETPGYGSFYDDVGNTAKSPHIKRCEIHYTNPAEEAWQEPTLWWFDNGKTRKRIAWLSSLEHGEAQYQGLEPNAQYILRITGLGKPQIMIDGQKINNPDEKGIELGEFKDYVVPSECIQDREITVKWTLPVGDLKKNWRQQSRICEMWLLKQ